MIIERKNVPMDEIIIPAPTCQMRGIVIKNNKATIPTFNNEPVMAIKLRNSKRLRQNVEISNGLCNVVIAKANIVSKNKLYNSFSIPAGVRRKFNKVGSMTKAIATTAAINKNKDSKTVLKIFVAESKSFF
jgi:hypothetical protein